MQSVAALAIEGAKGVGKTATAARRAESVRELDDPGQRSIAVADPARLLDGPPPVLIDEWQYLPEAWDLVRRAVDAGASREGSCSPAPRGLRSEVLIPAPPASSACACDRSRSPSAV